MAKVVDHLTPDEQLRREAVWRTASAENTATARRQYREIARRLRLGPSVVPAFVNAGMEISRQYSMECCYSNYQLRTGHAWPPEQQEAEEQRMQRDWEAALRELEVAVRS
ncbi:MAG TPA: hypothetical protein VJ957_07775 [Longimicrobiales bacterium]|nr:hypothetical protein [Longimicrobiales bacterium]